MCKSSPKTRRVAILTTASVVSFSLTLLGAGIAILAGILPLANLAAVDRTDLGSMLIASPILVLMLALIVEATRIALRTTPLPNSQPVGRLAPVPARWDE